MKAGQVRPAVTTPLEVVAELLATPIIQQIIQEVAGIERHVRSALRGLIGRRSGGARGMRTVSFCRAARIHFLHIVRLNVRSSCMISRPFWLGRIEECWRKAPIVWLSGVRRSGKTTLCRELGDTEFLNCDLPSSQRLLADPEASLSLAGPTPVGAG